MLRPAIGRDTLEYRDALHPERPLVIHTYRPGAHAPDDPVVLVQHGIRHNGDEYRDFWIDAAEKHRLLVVATTFGNGAFPQPENYNNGSVVTSDGTIRPREGWLYAILPRVVEALREGGVTCRAQARLFGHSAGGQFVHRLMATQGHALYEATSSKRVPSLKRKQSSKLPAEPSVPPEAFLRFYQSAALRRKTLSLLGTLEQAPHAALHREALADFVLELTTSGMDCHFMRPLRLAKPGVVVERRSAAAPPAVVCPPATCRSPAARWSHCPWLDANDRIDADQHQLARASAAPRFSAATRSIRSGMT